MAKIYTEKFAEKIDERFYPTTVTHAATNNDYDFVGAKTIKITSVNVGKNKDYDREKGYGEAQTIDNAIQELTMRKDRGFKIVLDKMDEEETKIKAGEVLARQKREVTDPELEKYRLGVMLDVVSASANNKIIGTAGKAYENFLTCNEILDDANIPTVGRVAFVTPAYLKQIKLDDNFIKASDIAQNMRIKGQVGEIDGVAIVKVTKAWMEDNTADAPIKYDCLIAHRSATIAPVKLAEYKVITDSEDYSGTVFLGRFYYDCFVLNNKKAGLVGITSVTVAKAK